MPFSATDLLHRDALKDYNEQMARSLGSKLFFLPHIPVGEVTQFVDFGCGDASLLKSLHSAAPRAETVGVDYSAAQRKLALKNFPAISDLVESLDHVDVRPHSDMNVLILSSVLHELLTSGTRERVLTERSPLAIAKWFSRWWAGVELKGFDYICLRDFSVSGHHRRTKTPAKWVDRVCASSADNWQKMLEVSARWGSCTNSVYSFMHYLLKRPYADNWAMELAEDYLAIDTETLLGCVTASGKYAVKHFAATSTKFFEESTLRDLAFSPGIPTHAELVLVRTEWHHDEVNLVEGAQSVSTFPTGPLMDGTWRARPMAGSFDRLDIW